MTSLTEKYLQKTVSLVFKYFCYPRANPGFQISLLGDKLCWHKATHLLTSSVRSWATWRTVLLDRCAMLALASFGNKELCSVGWQRRTASFKNSSGEKCTPTVTWLSLLSLALATYPFSECWVKEHEMAKECGNLGGWLVWILARVVAGSCVAECWWTHAWLAVCSLVQRSWENGILFLYLGVE